MRDGNRRNRHFIFFVFVGLNILLHYFDKITFFLSLGEFLEGEILGKSVFPSQRSTWSESKFVLDEKKSLFVLSLSLSLSHALSHTHILSHSCSLILSVRSPFEINNNHKTRFDRHQSVHSSRNGPTRQKTEKPSFLDGKNIVELLSENSTLMLSSSSSSSSSSLSSSSSSSPSSSSSSLSLLSTFSLEGQSYERMSQSKLFNFVESKKSIKATTRTKYPPPVFAICSLSTLMLVYATLQLLKCLVLGRKVSRASAFKLPRERIK